MFVGYVFVIGLCIACRQIFGFNPHGVPVLVWKDRREPVCRACAERWKTFHPEIDFEIPTDAYEPIADHELPIDEMDDYE